MKVIHAQAVGMSAFGPLLPLACVRFCESRFARRGRRYPQGAHAVAVSASLRLRCGARLGVAPLNSLRSLRSLRSNRRGESVLDARCARRLQGCAPRRHRNRPLRVPPAALQRLWFAWQTPTAILGVSEELRDLAWRPFADMSWFFVAENQTLAARQAAPGGGDFWGDEQRRTGVGARSAHPKLTRRVCLSVVSAANAASLAARPQAEQVSPDSNSPVDCSCLANGRSHWAGAACKACAVGAKRRPPQHEPPAGAACRAAQDVARIANVQTAATGQKRAFTAAPTLNALQVASRGVGRMP